MVVSGCLVGLTYRYHGRMLAEHTIGGVKAFLEGKLLVPVCPEQMGGPAALRPRLEIRRGAGNAFLEGACRAFDSGCIDRTGELIEGATQVDRVSAILGRRCTALKQNSPSSETTYISRPRIRLDVMGVTCALLKRRGLKILNGDDLK